MCSTVCPGYLTLAEALHGNPGRYSQEWNFGPADADMQTVAHVVEVLARPWGIARPWVQDQRAHPHEEMDLRLNSQKANRELRWVPKLPLDEALSWTADWFRRHRCAESPRALCEEQIDRYMQLPSHAH